MFDVNEPAGSEGSEGFDSPAVTGGAAACAVLATMASLPASLLDEDELVSLTLAMETARRFLDATELACLAELDRRGTTETRFGHTTVAWLAHEAKLPRSIARSRVRTARKITSQLEPVADALRRGDIGFDHARVLADAANPRNTDELAGLTGELCDAATVTTFERWATEARGLADLLDTDGGHDPTDDLPDPRLSIHRVGDITTVSGQLCGDGAHSTHTALNQIADELFHAYTRDTTTTGQPVPPRSQLLAEALVELCRRGLAVDAGSSTPPRTDATVVINALEPDNVTDTTGTRLTDTSLLLCDPLLWPIITTFTGIPLALGRSQRLATPHQTRAVHHRDGGCVFPGCDAPPTWTDTHHTHPWATGGTTDTDHMTSLCRRHHRLAHTPGWQLHLHPDGWTHWTRPDNHTFWGQRHQHQRHDPPPPQPDHP